MNLFTRSDKLRRSRVRAKGKAKITVQSSESKAYNQIASPALMDIRLSEMFTGNIDGESTVRALRVLRDDQSACLVSVQRFRGRLADARHLRASRFRNRRDRRLLFGVGDSDDEYGTLR
jgi:hypothetical protein